MSARSLGSMKEGKRKQSQLIPPAPRLAPRPARHRRHAHCRRIQFLGRARPWRPDGRCRARARSRCVCVWGWPPTATHGAESGGGLLSAGALLPSHDFHNRSRRGRSSDHHLHVGESAAGSGATAGGGVGSTVVPCRPRHAHARRAGAHAVSSRLRAYPQSAIPSRPRAASNTHRWAVAGGRGAARARTRFKSRPWLWDFAMPQWPPQPRALATAPLAPIDAAWGRGWAAPGRRQTRQRRFGASARPATLTPTPPPRP